MVFTCRIGESEFIIGMIDGVYFANMEKESESEWEWWGPALFENGKCEIDSHGVGGNESPILRIDHFVLPKIKNAYFILFYN